MNLYPVQPEMGRRRGRRSQRRMKLLVLFSVSVSFSVHMDTQDGGEALGAVGAYWGERQCMQCSEHHLSSGHSRRGVQRSQEVICSWCWRKHKEAHLKLSGLNDATCYLQAKQRRDAGYRLFQHHFGSSGSGTV